MRKTILRLVIALAVLSACEKINEKDLSYKPTAKFKADTIAVIPPDTTIVTPPVVTPPDVTPAIVTSPYVVRPPVVIAAIVASPYIVRPPVVIAAIVAPAYAVRPPVVIFPAGDHPVTPPVVKPPVVVPPVVKPPVVIPPVVIPPVGISFSKEVVPVLAQCEGCHTHGWTPSTVASTYYTNLVKSGYVQPTAYSSSTIYLKLSSGHPGAGNVSTVNTDKIINWMKQGSLNN